MKTTYLKSTVLSVNDMLYHTYYSEYVAKVKNANVYSVSDIREKVSDINYNYYGGNIIILFTFSDDYLYYCSEFISCANMVMKLKSKSEPTGRLGFHTIRGKDGIKRKFCRAYVNTNYLLVSASAAQINQLFRSVELSNPFLVEFTDIVYRYIDQSLFKGLIDDSVLMARGFYDTYKEYDYTDNNIENFGSNIEYKNDGEYKIVWYDNIDNLLHKLPSVFNSYDIIQMAHVTVCGIKNYEYYDCCITHLISRCLLEQYRITLTNIEKRMIDLIEINKLLYDNVVKGEYRCRFLGAAVAPLYMREDEDDSIQSDGDNVDQEYINDIKGANVYIPIINDNDTLIDIDEQLAEDDPEYSQIDEELK